MKENKSKGAFIPYHILFDDDLTPREKIIWADINSLEVCFKSLQTLAEQHGMAKTNISKTLKRMKEKGYLEEIGNDGRHKQWRALMDSPLKPMSTQSCQKRQLSVVKNVNSLTDKETEVGDKTYEIDGYIDANIAFQDSDSKNTTRMKPSTLKQQLVQIFKHKGIIDHQKALRGIQKLQAIFDDDSILELARSGASQKPLELNDGSEWRPNFLWFTNPENTEKVSNWAERTSNKQESKKLNLDEIDPLDIKIWDWAIKNKLAKDYEECHSDWGHVLMKIVAEPKLYREWQEFAYE